MDHGIWNDDRAREEEHVACKANEPRELWRLPPREWIRPRLATARHVYRIATGTVMLSRSMPDGRRQVLEFLGAGGFLTAEELRDTRAQTLTAVDLLVLRRRDLRQLPALQQEFDAHLRQRLAGMHRHAVMLGRKTATERLCTFLLDASAPTPLSSTVTRQERTVHVGLSQCDIADYLGLGAETVCRELKKLKAAGLISQPRHGAMILTNVPALTALAEQTMPPKPYRSERPRLRVPRQEEPARPDERVDFLIAAE